MELLKQLKNFFEFAYTKDEPVMEQMSEEEYKQIFLNGRQKVDIETTYKKAWEAKNFEIEHYWKRANYFWAFQVASFAGYFTFISSKGYETNPQVLYFIICIGFITCLAWIFTNKGSKTWQRHWEIHVDMLENEITGPLYKIVTAPKTYSVSKINEIVSRFINSIWIILAIKYFIDNLTLEYTTFTNIDFLIWLSTLSVLYFVSAMKLGYGRGRFGERKVKFYKRKFKTD